MIKVLILVACNYIRLSLKRLKNRHLKFELPQMIGWDSRMLFHPDSSASIGKNLVTDGRFVIITDKGSSLTIGDHVYFNEGGMISCKGEVTIGSGCKFGPNVKIFDNNHCFTAEEGVLDMHKAGSIQIGDHCWIAANAVILKDAKIGAHSVIGAGCTIDFEVPPCSIVKQENQVRITKIGER